MPQIEIEIESDLRKAMLKMIRATGQILENGISLLTEKRYPEIDDFKVSVYPNESKHRGRPHCQVRIQGKTATFDIETCELMAGDISPWKKTVQKTLEQHHNGLLQFWKDTRPDDQKFPTKDQITPDAKN